MGATAPAAFGSRTLIPSVTGKNVMVCSNLEFGGDDPDDPNGFGGHGRTKQTTQAWDRLGPMVENTLSKIHGTVEKMEHRINLMQNWGLSQERGDAMLVQIYRQKGLSSSQLGRALQLVLRKG